MKNIHFFVTFGHLGFESEVIESLTEVDRESHEGIFDGSLTLKSRYLTARYRDGSDVEIFTVLKLNLASVT